VGQMHALSAHCVCVVDSEGVSVGVVQVVEAAWPALLDAQLPSGALGWVQQIGTGPDEVAQDNVQLYGSGAFLQAAAGVLRLVEMGMLGAAAPAAAPAS
jgi:hypothetical protein